MTRALIVYCHPKEGSFTSAVRDTVLSRLAAKGAEVRVIDLYARAFDPTLSLAEWEGYLDTPAQPRDRGGGCGRLAAGPIR